MARDLDEMEDDNVTPEDLEGNDTGVCHICGEHTFNYEEFCSEECAIKFEDSQTEDETKD